VKLIAIGVACIVIGCNHPAEPTTPPPPPPPDSAMNEQTDKPVAAQRFTGTLRGGILAAGAETTGWVLETDDGKRLDVDVSQVADAAAALEGKRVTAEGVSTTANWPERGPRTLLRAHQIVPADDPK